MSKQPKHTPGPDERRVPITRGAHGMTNNPAHQVIEFAVALPEPYDHPGGKISLTIYFADGGKKILQPGDYPEWLKAAYYLKGCSPACGPKGNYEVWRRWASQVENFTDDAELHGKVWLAIDPYRGWKNCVDAVAMLRMNSKPDAPVERHPVQLVVKVSHDKFDPKPITLFVEDSREHPIKITELDPNNNADMVKAVYCLKSKDICPTAFNVQADGFKLLERWHGQAEAQMPDLDLLTMWQSVLPAERFEGNPPAGDAPDPIQSARSRIGQLLDEHTNLADTLTDSWADQGRVAVDPDAIIVDNLPKLQQRLADLFAELHKHHTADQLVLKARGATVQDCHSLGLLSDDDMANHLADCLMVILGKPVSAKAAKAIMLTAVEYSNGEPAYLDVKKKNEELRGALVAMRDAFDVGQPATSESAIGKARSALGATK